MEDSKKVKKGSTTLYNDINHSLNLSVHNKDDITIEIPKQIITGNICPCNPKGKGDYYIPQSKILDTAKYLNINPDSIPQEVWSKKNNNVYVSWKGFYKLPEPIQTHWKELELKKGLGYGIKTGKQQDGRFIIVFDCDNDNNKATEYKDFLINTYGETFIRDTPSRGFHVYYECPEGGILKEGMHIDLRFYITINYKPLDLEIKQGSFIRENGTSKDGKGYSTFMDSKITKLDPEIDLIKAIKNKYASAVQIKEFTETTTSTVYNNKESLKVLDDELLDILNTKYLQSYISTTLKGHRDNLIIPATFGFLIKRNMPRQQMEAVLEWINKVAENKKQGTPNIRNYNFDNIPDILSGSGILRKHGFDEFVDAIDILALNKNFEIRLPREPRYGTKRTAIYPIKWGGIFKVPAMEYSKTEDNGEIKTWYEPLATGLQILDANVYLPLYEELGVTTYDVNLIVRGEPIKYKKVSAEHLLNKLESNHAIYLNNEIVKASKTLIEIIHSIAIKNNNIGWTAGGKGIYYDYNKNKIVSEDIPPAHPEHVKKALLEVNKLFDAMYPDTREEMAGIMLWYLSGAFNLVRKQMGYPANHRQPAMINAGDINRGKSESAELGARLWQSFQDLQLTERTSKSFSTIPRRREAVGVSTIPIRVEEYDARRSQDIAEFEEDLRDYFNSVYAQIQKQNGDTRLSLLRAIPYISTNDKMIFLKASFAKRVIVYETSESIPKEAMEVYAKQKEQTDFTKWQTIGAMATQLVINNEIDLNQPWKTFALELIEKIYKKVGLPLHKAWTIPELFTTINSQKLINDNVEETLLHIMQRAIINKLPGIYDEDRITTDIAVLAKELKTNWLFLLENGNEDTVVIKTAMFERIKEETGTSSIPRGKTKEILSKNGATFQQSGVKMLGAPRSSGIIIKIDKLAKLLFGEPKFIDST